MAGYLFTSRAWGNLGLDIGDVDSLVFRNRQNLKSALSLDSLHFMRQTHSDTVMVAAGEDSVFDCDALITSDKGTGLAVLVGDCLPIIVTSSSVVGVIHAGRKGMMNGIVQKTIAQMRELGGKDLVATIGPSICRDCYEVSPQRYQEIIQNFPSAATNDEIHALDLAAEVKNQLTKMGIRTEVLGACTRENNGYFSHRRSTQKQETQGRQVGVVFL